MNGNCDFQAESKTTIGALLDESRSEVKMDDECRLEVKMDDEPYPPGEWKAIIYFSSLTVTFI